jgi:hypothetical protein
LLFVSEKSFQYILFNTEDKFLFLKNPSLYSNHLSDGKNDYYNTNYWKLNYLFNRPIDFDYPHTQLGWSGFFYRSYEHLNEKDIKNRRPVLLFGDSFAMCSDTVQCFEDILNSDEEFSKNNYLLNYGVGGYGVDQISILFNEAVDRFKNPIVIFSLLTSDMDRSLLQARDGQKPYFVLEKNELILKGTPISLSSNDFFHKNPPDIHSYLFNKYKGSNLNIFKNQEDELEQYIYKSKALNKAILLKTIQKLKENKTDFLFLIFHPEHFSSNDWRLEFLKELFINNDVPYLCDLDLRETDNTFEEYNPFNYALKDDGHPTTYLNKLVSSEIKKFTLKPDYRINFKPENYLSYIESKIIKDVKYYKRLILKSPKWLESIKLKASQRNITADSMIYLDALYKANEIKDVLYYKRKIQSNHLWLKATKEKALTRSIPLDSMVTLEAEYMLQNN